MPRITKPCETCGNLVTRRPSQISGPRREHTFCSRKCYGVWRAKEFVGERHHNYTDRVPVTCAACGKPMLRTPAHIAKHEHYFCNRRCKGDWQIANLTDVRHPSFVGAMKCIPCAWCGHEVRRYQSQITPYRYQFCNEQCAGKWHSEYRVGENNPHWKGGPIDYYGPNWVKQKRATRKRDDHKCRACGRSEKQNGRALDVHHIRPFREFDYIYGENENYLLANELTNLISLCNRCHTLVEHHKIAIQPYLL